MKLVRTNALPTLWQEDSNLFFDPIERHFQSVFDEFINTVLSDSKTFVSIFDKHSYPKVNVIDESDKIVVEAEIPGLTKDEVAVTVSHNCLVIKGEKKKDSNEKRGTYLRRELRHSSFSRCIGELGENVDKDSIEATFQNGILTISIKKVKPTQRVDEVKKIEIK